MAFQDHMVHHVVDTTLLDIQDVWHGVPATDLVRHLRYSMRFQKYFATT